MSENTTNNKAKGGDKSSLPIGIRQKNYLNIRCVNGQKWVGQMFRRPDDKFCTFEDELFGYRAALKIIAVTYRKRVKRWMISSCLSLVSHSKTSMCL